MKKALVLLALLLGCGGEDENKFDDYVAEICRNMEACGLLATSQSDCRALFGDQLKHTEDPENCARCGRTLSCSEWQQDPIRCDIGAACQER
jgi:hypothetical protein